MSKNNLSKKLLEYIKDLGFKEHERPTVPELKKRWKDLCRKHHPDAGGDQKEFLRVTHAYNMLTDPEYQHKHFAEEVRRKASSGNLLNDLDIVITMPIRFEDGFFGRRIGLSYSSFELTEDLQAVGDTAEVHTVSVDVPSGTLQNYQQFFEGRGHRRGESRGDFTVTFVTRPHPVFRVEGWDIVSQAPVPLETLLKGGKIDVQTMYGLQVVKVPPGTKPNGRLHIKNHGVNRVGVHYVEVIPVFPTKEDLKNGEAWRDLKIDWGEDEKDSEADEFLKLFRSKGGSGVFTFNLE